MNITDIPKILLEALNRDKDANTKLFNDAVNFFEKKQYDKACDLYTKLIETSRFHESRAHTNRGVCYEQLGEDAKALEDYKTAIKIDDEDYLAYYQRSRLYARMGESCLALSDVGMSLSLMKEDEKIGLAKMYVHRGKLYYKEFEEYQLAIDDLTKSIECDPTDDMPYHIRGMCYYRIGMFKEAKEDFIKSAQLDRDMHPDVVGTLRDLDHNKLGEFLRISDGNEMKPMQKEWVIDAEE